MMNPSSILIWNARGLSKKDRCNSVRDVILSSNAEIVCLQETKVESMNQHLFLSVFGSSFDKFVALPANGTRSVVLIAWKSNTCQAIAAYSVSLKLSEQEGCNWWFTGVYSPQENPSIP
jgi:exonuclease III